MAIENRENIAQPQADETPHKITVKITDSGRPENDQITECGGVFMVYFTDDGVGVTALGQRTIEGWAAVFASEDEGVGAELRSGAQAGLLHRMRSRFAAPTGEVN